MYTNAGNGPIEAALTPAQLQTLKTEYLSLTAAGQPCAGYSDSQVADYLNQPGTIANPKPASIPAAVIPAADVRIVLDGLLTAVEAVGTSDPRYTLYTNRLNFLAANLSSDTPATEPQLLRLIAAMTADNTLTAAQATKALYVPDGTWVPSLSCPDKSWAYTSFSGWLEAADVTLAKSS